MILFGVAVVCYVEWLWFDSFLGYGNDVLKVLILFRRLFILTSKERHFLTRKLVGYRNWKQKWCKKLGNKVL